MKHDLLKKVEIFLNNRKKKKTARAIAAALAAAMAVTTTNAMILPAISLEKKAAENEAGIFMEATSSDAKKTREHTASNATVIADGGPGVVSAAQETPTAANAKKESHERVYRDQEIEIIATYSNAANIPDEAEFVVERLEPGEFPEATQKMTGEEFGKLRSAGKEDDTEEKSGIGKTLAEVEAFIKSLLEKGEQGVEEPLETEEAAETETSETLESIRLNIEEETEKAETDAAWTETLPESEAVGNSDAKVAGTADGNTGAEIPVKEAAAEEYTAGEGMAEGDTAKEGIDEGDTAKEGMAEADMAETDEAVQGNAGLRYKIGFYLDGIEIEPQDTVSLSVRFFADEFAEADGVQVIHYLDNHENADTETIEPDTEVDEDGNMKAVFDMDSFSVVEFLAVGRAAPTIREIFTLTVGETFIGGTTDENIRWESPYSFKVSIYSGDSVTVKKTEWEEQSGWWNTVTVQSFNVAAVKAGTTIVQVDVTDYWGDSTTSYYEFVVKEQGEILVMYDLGGDFERVGADTANMGVQAWNDDVSVKGLDGTSESANEGTYTVRDISSDTRISKINVKDKGDFLSTYHFVGWKRSDTGKIIEPGTELTGLTTDITLKAVWCVHFEHDETYCYETSTKDKDLATVSFYIAIVNAIGSFDPNRVDKYTDALYTTRVVEGQAWANAHTGSVDFYGNSNGADYAAADAGIRAYAESGIKNGNDTFRLEAMPSDDLIFGRIRTWKERYIDAPTINIAGVKYNAEDITADNFEIKWYVVKSQTSDGWHIDGVLLPRQAKLTVTKTFIGDDVAISQVKGGYGIAVYEGKTTNASYTLNLREKTDDNPGGYEAVSEDKNTYTWVLENMLTSTAYTVEEVNYQLDSKEWITTAAYQISNSKNGSNDTNGWKAYSDNEGITVSECYSYQDSFPYSAYQTVALRNIYTKPFVLTLLKQDGTTLHGLADVKFELTLTKKGGGNSSSTVTSGPNGKIAVDFSEPDLGAGDYTFILTEGKYEGYESGITITGNVSVSVEGAVSVSNLEVVGLGENQTVATVDANQSLVYIVNHSKRRDITVRKQWMDQTNKQVTMQLLLNGTPYEESAVLSNENNWEKAWIGLPAYVDGKEAEYSVRETWIGVPGAAGSSSYTSGDDTDGYADYIVTSTETTDADGNITIVVKNMQDNGQVMFTKVDEAGRPLSGAEFTVYSDKECQNIVSYTYNGEAKTAVFESDENGVVTVAGLSQGTYYLKETKAPDGYAENRQVYTLTVKANNSSLTLDGTIVEKIENTSIQVSLSFRKVTNDNGKDMGLSGAEFVLYDAENYSKYTGEETLEAVETERWISDGNAHALQEKLPVGAYYLVETKAPDGYHLLTGPVKITVGGDGSVSAEAQGAGKETVRVGGGNGSYTISVYNLASLALPNTGDIGTTIYKFGGLLFMAGAAIGGCVLKRRRERRAV